MTMMTTPAACIVAVVGGVVGWWWWERPRVRVRLAIATAMGSNVEIADGGLAEKRKGNWPRPKFSACLPVGPSGARARVCVGSWDGVPGKRWDGMGWSRKSRSLRLWDDMMSDTGDGNPSGEEGPTRRRSRGSNFQPSGVRSFHGPLPRRPSPARIPDPPALVGKRFCCRAWNRAVCVIFQAFLGTEAGQNCLQFLPKKKKIGTDESTIPALVIPQFRRWN